MASQGAMIVINGNITRSRSDGHDESDLLLIVATNGPSDLHQSGRSQSTAYLATRGDGLISIRQAFIRDGWSSFVKNHDRRLAFIRHDRRLAFIRHDRRLAFDPTHLIFIKHRKDQDPIATRSWSDCGHDQARSWLTLRQNQGHDHRRDRAINSTS